MAPFLGGGPAAATPPTFPALRKQRIAMQTVDAIKEMIRSGELVAGQALPPERELAEALGISRPTLREAIGALTAMNIVESRHGEGTFVTSLSPSLLTEPIAFLLLVDDASLLHLMEVRRALEGEAAARAAEVIDQRGLERIGELVGSAAAVVDEASEFAALDFALHTAIVEAVGNPILVSLYDGIARLLLESRRRTATDAAMRTLAQEDHRRILRALSRHSPSAARRVMLDHLGHVEKALGRSLGEGGTGSDD